MHTSIHPAKLFLLIIIMILYPVMLQYSALIDHTAASGESAAYAVMDKSLLHIRVSSVNPSVSTLAANTDNGFVIKVQVSDETGAGVAGAGVRLEISRSAADFDNSAVDSADLGTFHPNEGITDSSGSFLSVYSPPAAVPSASEHTADTSNSKGISTGNGTGNRNGVGIGISNGRGTGTGTGTSTITDTDTGSGSSVTLTAHLTGTEKSSSMKMKLVPVPIVLIHGYQASPTIFSGLSEYLKSEGFTPISFSYQSENGVAAAAADLADFLHQKVTELASENIQVNRFDLISHSMGGLIARYYTCSSDYSLNANIRKLLFISVPHKGSPFASIGLTYYNDSGMQDLVPESELYSTVFPSMINGGLNPSIQTGNLLGRFDEVVGVESAALNEWGIHTELFDVGDSNFTLDKLLSGEILQATNHKMVLYNRKVFQRLRQMLETELQYPQPYHGINERFDGVLHN